MKYFGHVKEKIEDNKVTWACTKCGQDWPTAKGTQIHVTRTCWKFVPRGNKMVCPFCNKEYKERKTLTGHIIQSGCDIMRKDFQNLTGEEIWEKIVEKNTEI